jgi:pyridoxamine 5'-phosphate oxidase
MNLSEIRRDYQLKQLDPREVNADPIRQFEIWMNEALDAKISDPTAMTLATASPEGKPSARIVLLKYFSHDGFFFFTNYDSRKGNELEENDQAALLFFWPELERQVRVEGAVVKCSPELSDSYFASRPPESQLSAAVSPQSKEVKDRSSLEELRKKKQEEIGDGTIQRPDFWGGYRLLPAQIEFWQGRANRLHDRVLYLRDQETWKVIRLAP